MTHRWTIRVLVLLALLLGGPAIAAERLALVIGNRHYASVGEVRNAANDAGAVAERLRELGFTLIGRNGQDTTGPVLDLDDTAFYTTVRDFAARAEGAEIALVYYAGHGMQIAGEAILLPIDVPSSDLGLLRRKSLALEQDILDPLDGKAQVTVAVFDACREIPALKRAVTRATRASGYGAAAYRGLARVRGSGSARLIAYAGADGELVADGDGEHSPFTGLLLEYLDKKTLQDRRLDLVDLFGEVQWQFRRRHGGQEPELINQGVRPNSVYLVASPGLGGSSGGGGLSNGSVAQPSAEAIERALELTRDERRRVQQALNGLGHAVGEADGVWGRRTREGIAAWQRAAGREPSGYLDADGYKALLAAAAQHGPKPADVFRDTLRDGGQGPEMVVIPAGSFQMGSSDRDDDEKPVHRVTISRAFAMGRYEVTFEDYDRFARATGRKLPNDRGWGRGRRPVINVSWEDATAYAKWLSRQTGAEYRLPSEAEWEYAARAGTQTAYWWGDHASREYANYGKNDSWGGLAQGRDRWKYTAPVGSFPPNPWGLYDTAGNVWEWVFDWYDKDAYFSHPAADPIVRQGGSRRVGRGGSWSGTPRYLRSANRRRSPGSSYSTLGFRLAKTLSPLVSYIFSFFRKNFFWKVSDNCLTPWLKSTGFV